MSYYYEIAGIRILLDLPFSISIQESSKEFLKEGFIDDYDICFKYIEIDSIDDNISGHEESNHCYIEDDNGYRVYYRPEPNKPPYAYVEYQNNNLKMLYCYYIKGNEFRLNYSMSICNMMSIETVLLNFQFLLLHSSFIRYKDMGILFSASSGVGKSTQADLWVKYENAEILNGDRAGLKKNYDQWCAYGLPYAGSSKIYRNESAPIKAIIMLEQAPINEIRKLSPREAMMLIYPQITIHTWDRRYVEKILPLIEDLVTTIPIYKLRCLPDKGAVETVKKCLGGI
ncbi:MAG: hypothetical protein LUH02_01365 [Erysipelotrichaceae bacterium]|nr:hypothetical protein [Erysipelotrichaceae bacterium]